MAKAIGHYRKIYGTSESLEFFYNDNLDSRRVVISSSGTKRDTFEYSSWGNVTHSYGSNNYLAAFTGKDYDATGFIYSNARYYDPTTGRFLTEDPSRKGVNWYAYCENDPINKTDPTGMFPVDEVVQMVERASLGDMQAARMVAAYMTPRAQVKAIASTVTLSWPTRGEVSSEFGPRAPIETAVGFTSPTHRGIDIADVAGTRVNAAAGGKVLEVDYQPKGYGYYIIVGHDSKGWAGLTTRYAHLQALPQFQKGESVIGGQQMGTIGSTGMAEGPHLHFEVRVNNVAQDPRNFLR